MAQASECPGHCSCHGPTWVTAYLSLCSAGRFWADSAESALGPSMATWPPRVGQRLVLQAFELLAHLSLAFPCLGPSDPRGWHSHSPAPETRPAPTLPAASSPRTHLPLPSPHPGLLVWSVLWLLALHPRIWYTHYPVTPAGLCLSLFSRHPRHRSVGQPCRDYPCSHCGVRVSSLTQCHRPGCACATSLPGAFPLCPARDL